MEVGDKPRPERGLLRELRLSVILFILLLALVFYTSFVHSSNNIVTVTGQNPSHLFVLAASHTPSITLYINGSTTQDVKIHNDDLSNFTAVAPNPNDYVGLIIANDSGLTPMFTVPLTRGMAVFTGILPGNTEYKVTAFSNSSGITNVTHFETEADAPPTCSGIPTAIWINNVASTNVTVTYSGSSSTIIAQFGAGTHCSGTGYIYVNNVQVSTATFSNAPINATYTATLSAGTYHVHANNSVTTDIANDWEIINKATPTLSITTIPSINFTQNGTALRFNFSISSINNQVAGKFYVNGSLKNSSITTTGTNLYNAGTSPNIFIGIFNTTGNANYTSSSVTKAARIKPVPPRASLYLNGVSNASTTINYYTQSNFTCTISVGYCTIWANVTGSITRVAGLSKNHATYLKTLTAGNYTVVAGSNTSGSANMTYYEKINRAAPTLSITTIPSINFTQNGTALRFNFSISSINNQVAGKFYVNGLLKNSSITTTGTNLYNAGTSSNTFIGIFNTTGNPNYTSASIKKAAQIKPNIVTNLYLNGALNANTSITYGTQSNFTATVTPSTDYVEVWVNGTKYVALTQGKAAYLNTLPAGKWEVTEGSNATGASNTTYWETITKASPTLTLNAKLASFTYNGTKENFTYGVTSLNNQLTAKLYKNSINVASTTTSTNYRANATAGTYAMVLNTTGNQNYSSATTSLSRTISKAAVSQTLSASGSYTPYDNTPPTITDTFNKTIVAGQSGLSFTLQNNSVSTSSTQSVTTAISSFNFPALAGKYSQAGSYSYGSSAVSNVNYSFKAASSLPLTIIQATPSITLTATRANFTYNGTTENISGNVNSINSQVSGQLYVNDVSETSPYKNATAGTFSAWFNTTANQNYTAAQSHLVRKISQATTTVSITASLANFVYNSTKETFTGSVTFPNSGVSGTLYINGLSEASPYSNATAGTYNAVFNTSGNINYSSATTSLSRTISKMAVSQTLSSSGSYSPYDNTPPTITDTFNKTIVAGQSSLTFTLQNNSISTGSAYSATTAISSFNFPALAGKYSQAGSYTYSSQTVSNVNYSFTTASTLQVTITKATPSITLTVTRANFTYNGTTENITGLVTSINSQVSGQLYINNIAKSSPYKNATAGIFSAWFNTTANQNYSAAQSHIVRQIYKATTTVSLTVTQNNFVYNGTAEKFTGLVTFPVSGATGKLYINGISKTSPYSNATAGTFNAVFNTTSSINYTSATAGLSRTISKASITQSLSSNPASPFQYNGSAPIITDTLTASTGKIVSGQSSLTFTLFNASISTGSTASPSLSSTSFSFAVLAGKYAAVHYPNAYSYSATSSGNVNYTVTTSSNLAVNITRATPSTSVTWTRNNFTYNGTTDNATGTISSYNDQVTGKLYINGAYTGLSSTTTTSAYKNATAGTYNVIFNASAGQNYTSATSSVSRTISKATITQSLSSNPVSPFSYSGSVPTITDTLTSNTVLVPQSSISFILNNGSVSTSSTGSSTLSSSSFTFSALPGKYASADPYSYTSQSSGNQNYTITASASLILTIDKAAPTLTITSTPDANFTQNGTDLRFHFSVSTVNNQLSGNFYINGSLKNSSITTSGVYNAGSAPNIFIGTFNTTGNRNYTALSITISRQVYAIALALYLNGVRDANATISYGTQSNFTATLSNNYMKVYVNGTQVTSYTKNFSTYLNTLAAGLYKVIAQTNLSSVNNITYYEKINKAAPTISLTATRANFTYNGTTENISGSVTTPLSGVSGTLYINNIGEASPYKNATAGIFSAWFNTTSNQNYSAVQSHLIRKILPATPPLTLTPATSGTYNGNAFATSFGVSTINDQLTASLYVNGINKSSTPSSNSFDEYSSNTYSLIENTSGNQNYTSASTSGSFSISKATPSLVISDNPGNFTYNGTKDNTSAIITSVNNQLSGKLYINGKLSSSTTSNTYYANATVGTFAGVFNTTGNQNYTGSSMRTKSIISIATPTVSLTANRANFTYNGTAMNITSSITSGLVGGEPIGNLYINGVSKGTPYKNATAGVWIAWFNTTGNINWTATQTRLARNISQATPTLTLTPALSGTYTGSAFTSTFAIATLNNQLTAKAYSNGISKGSTTTSSTFSEYTANTYDIVENTTGNINYTSDSTSNSFTISKATPSITLTATRANFTYNGTTENISGNVNSINSQVSGQLYVNDVSETSPYKNATAGIFSAWFNTTANQNYSAAQSHIVRQIYKATTTVSLTATQNNFVYNGTAEKFTGLVTFPSSGVNGKLYINGAYQTSPYSNATAGTYNAIFNATGSINYTSATTSLPRTINKATITQSLSSNPASPFVYSGSAPIITDILSSNTLLVSGQSGLSFTLFNGSISTGLIVPSDLSSSSLSFSTLSGKYAAVHYPNAYSYSATSSGNVNYTVTTSSNLAVNITKALPTLSISWTRPNFIYNGTTENVTGTVSAVNNQVTAALFVNGLNRFSTTTTTSAYKNATAGAYTAVFNTTGDQNYSALSTSSSRTIAKAVVSQILTASGSYTPYDNTPPTVTDTFNKTLVGGQSGLTFTLQNNSIATGSTRSVTTAINSFDFQTLTGKYSQAGSYAYDSPVESNTNYSFTAATNLLVTINKAVPSLTLTTTPVDSNFTQNNSDIKFHFIISTANNQLAGSFYINGSLKNSSITTSGVYNAGSAPNIFIGTFNTSGNHNYTSYSVSIARQIYTIALALYLNGVRDANTTISYGTQSNFTVQLSENYVKIYVNGTQVEPYTKNSATYLKNLAAGLYEVVAQTNTSAVNNITYYEKINKATPTISLTATRGNFTYNGTTENISGNADSINSQVSGQLYIRDVAESSPYKNATAGTFSAWFNTTANQNYSAAQSHLVRRISPATPSLTLTPTISGVYTGSAFSSVYGITTVNGQLAAKLYVNGGVVNTVTSSLNTVNEYSANIYNLVENTSGNTNYTSNTASGSFSISKAVLSQTLKAFSPSGFIYDNFSPTMQDTLNASIAAGNSFTFTLDNGSTSVVTTQSHSGPFNFSALSGKYAAAGTYHYSSTAVSNGNYSILSSSTLIVTIDKATPSLTLTPAVSGTYNGNAFTTSFGISTIGNQLSASLYVNGINESSAVLSNTFDEYAANTYSLVENTSGNQNYSSNTKSGSFTISKANPTITLTATRANFTYNGTTENISGSVTSINSQVSGTLYINGISKTSPYKNATAGTLSAWFNTTANQNYSAAQSHLVRKISQAQTVLSLASSLANFTYNGSTEEFTGSVIVPSLGVSGKLYINGINEASPYANATAGTYNAVFNTSGSINYTSASVSSYRRIYKASISQSLKAFPASKFTYDGTAPTVQDTLSGTLVAGQSGLTFGLNNDSIATGALFSSSLSSNVYNFSVLAGKYAGASQKHNYTYTSSSSGNVNYTVTVSPILYVNITKSVPVLVLSKSPNINYTYNGTEENFTGSVTTPALGLSGKLYINGKSTGFSTYANATAGTYGAVFNTSGNRNYTAASTTGIIIISKAVPVLLLSTAPSANYTQNGTPLKLIFSASTIGNQLVGSFYINGSPENLSLTNGLYNAGPYPNIYNAIFNTSGNINYSSGSARFSRQLYTMILYLNGIRNDNATITYGTISNFTARVPSDFVRIYVNGTLVQPYTKNITAYLNTLAAGIYRVVAQTNSSVISNLTYYEQINKGTPAITLVASRGNFTYNGTTENISGSVSSVNNQVSGTLYVNNITKPSPYKNATAGTFSAWFNTTANQNYSAASSRLIREISQATPVLTLSAPSNFTYNGTLQNLSGKVVSFGSQLTAHFYVNGLSIGPTFTSIYYANATAGTYSGTLNTSGNVNYTLASTAISRKITKATPGIALSTPTSFTYSGSAGVTFFNFTTLNNQISANVTLNASLINVVPDVFVPLTIHNSQSNATTQGYQQEIVVNSSQYSAYENSSLDNVIFSYQNGSIIDSWLESGNGAGSQSTVYWLKLPSIPAGGQLVIRMVFLPESVSAFNNVTTGEAPTLSPVYGEYDNGGNVFQFYDDFAGSALNTAKWQTSGGATYTVSNGLTTFSPTNDSYIDIESKTFFSYPAFFEWYSGPFNETAPYSNELAYGYTSISSSEALYLGAPRRVFLQYATNGISSSYNSTYATIQNSAGNHIYTLAANGTDVVGEFDYSPVLLQNESFVPQGITFGLILNYKTGIRTAPIYWARIRSYVPGGVMPSVTAGALSKEGSGVDRRTAIGTYTYVVSSVGNVNYTAYSVQKAYQIKQNTSSGGGGGGGGIGNIIVPPPVINTTNIIILNENITGLNGINHTISLHYTGQNTSLTVNVSSIIPSNNFELPFLSIIPNGSARIMKITTNTVSNLSNASIHVNRQSSAECFGQQLNQNALAFYNISTNFNESTVIGGNVVYYFYVNNTAFQNLGYLPENISMYKCSAASGWNVIPTTLVGANSSGAYYKAYSDSLSIYAIAPTPLAQNVTQRYSSETFYESGLPQEYVWNVTYGGLTNAGTAGLSIVFNISSGQYPVMFYRLSNTSSSSSGVCTTTYSPQNFKPGVNYVVSSGGSLTVDYTQNTVCSQALPQSPTSNGVATLEIIVIPLFIVVVILLLVIIKLLLPKNGTRKTEKRKQEDARLKAYYRYLSAASTLEKKIAQNRDQISDSDAADAARAISDIRKDIQKDDVTGLNADLRRLNWIADKIYRQLR